MIVARNSFAENFAEARSLFVDAARARGARLSRFVLPGHRGPNGETLSTDVARIGRPPGKADTVLFINSGTHGVEGFCGSGCQIEILRSGLTLKKTAAVVLIHALNPFGFAHERRVNETNVDLNRNFVDHSDPLEDHPDYSSLHPHLVPANWHGPSRDAADRELEAWRAERGFERYQAAVTMGQYHYRDGLFYGGSEPAWSNLLFKSLVRTHSDGSQRIGFIDLHTGLGPNGHGEIIHTGSAADPSFARARDWYGDVTSTDDGSSSSSPVRGALSEAFSVLPETIEVTPIVLEFGTVPVEAMLEAVRADNWLYVHAGPESPHFRQIKQQIRAAFYDEHSSWKTRVVEQAQDLAGRAMKGLSA